MAEYGQNTWVDHTQPIDHEALGLGYAGNPHPVAPLGGASPAPSGPSTYNSGGVDRAEAAKPEYHPMDAIAPKAAWQGPVQQSPANSLHDEHLYGPSGGAGYASVIAPTPSGITTYGKFSVGDDETKYSDKVKSISSGEETPISPYEAQMHPEHPISFYNNGVPKPAATPSTDAGKSDLAGLVHRTEAGNAAVSGLDQSLHLQEPADMREIREGSIEGAKDASSLTAPPIPVKLRYGHH